MKTIVKIWKSLKTNQTNPVSTVKTEQTEDLSDGAALINQGGLVAFPTETVYGLGGNALDSEASKKIYAAKGRPSDNPLIVHIAELSDLEGLVKEIPPMALKLADAFWPGPLTMIFEKTDKIPYETTGGLDTVAVRMPAHSAALELIRLSGVPIAAPSANLSGHPSPTTAEHVLRDLSGRIDMIIDGGNCDIGVESTILDLTAEPPMILRPGYITKEMLEEEIGPVSVDPAIMSSTLATGNGIISGSETDPSSKAAENSSSSGDSLREETSLHPKAPGMKYRHYAPKAPLTLVASCSEDTEGRKQAETVLHFAEQALSEGKCVGLMGTEENLALYEEFLQKHEAESGNIFLKVIGSRKDPAGIARGLYGVLRDFDDTQVDCIYGESFETDHLGEAIMNRLLKAAGQHIVPTEN
ncbi:MAG: threonylcarbamoyl-AMP synthase [Lachnospiraceae bacterium]|nr:threonylcarbamoyl-AMP synthase [Lachnospiraceae bacterium]